MEYIDLGLHSGTLWADENEEGFYAFDEAVSKYSNSLPTKEQFEELKSQCQWEWIGLGYKVTGHNGNSIVLPANGLRNRNGDVNNVGPYGYYWSYTPNGTDIACDLYFNSNSMYMYNNYRCYGLSVRLVKKKDNCMGTKEQHLLMQDLCARLPYGVYIKGTFAEFDYDTDTLKDDGQEHQLNVSDIEWLSNGACNDIKPYLRSMEDMTEEEVKEFYDVECMDAKVGYIKPTSNWHFTINGFDWLNKHHFDYRGLIPMGLALESHKDMYNLKK